MEPFNVENLVNGEDFKAAIRKAGVLTLCKAAGVSSPGVYGWLAGKPGLVSLETRLKLAHALEWRVLVRAVPPRANKTYAGKRLRLNRRAW